MSRGARNLVVVGLSIATLVAVALAPGASAARDTQGAQSRATARTLTVGIQQSLQLLPVVVALRHRYFKGTDVSGVKFTIFSSLPAMFAAVAQGQIDVGYQTIPGIWAYNQATSGTKLKIIAPATNDSLMWFAKTGSTLPVTGKGNNWRATVRAWRGKTIGIPAVGGIIDLMTRYLLRQVGLDPDKDVKLSAVGTGPPGVAALQNGLVDIITGDPLTAALLKSENAGHAILSFPARQGPAELLGQPSGVFFTSEEQYAKEPKLYQDFNKAVARSRRHLANPRNRRDVLDLLTRKIGLTAAQSRILYEEGVPIFARGALNPTIFNNTIKAYAATGIMKAPYPSYGDMVFPFVQ
jgi:NitT/TauT family transport system substrate-binding protein